MVKKILLGGLLFLLILAGYIGYLLNDRFELLAFHAFYGSSQHDLKVLTWNIHCSNGTDDETQRKIAEVILEQDADFVQLNEFYQDSCRLLHHLLNEVYPFTEEYQSHHIGGDIFYSRQKMTDSGHVLVPEKGTSIQTLQATIPVDEDKVQIYGCHMASNSGDGSAVVSNMDSLKKVTRFYERYRMMQQQRITQAHWTAEKVRACELPVIVMGDLNDFSFAAPLDTFQAAGLINSWNEGGLGYGYTFHTGWMWLRIDHILHSSQLKLTGIKVVDTDLSDHRPVVAEFIILH